ncbi:lysophospholipid acyltransferase family protein [Ferrimonas marina]|uniref:L-ornithine N(alpha)-acyltransferase n=1 Tax=Ferrimonas marina TaxID=299255 RepID=A0A1M5Z6G1_9GAMM|nr:GNAT family N-acyltransferase [Ferrimonas marina]SHI19832.1 Putative hemolysin [Ferrimonas marina]
MITVDRLLDRHFPNLPLRPLATPMLKKLLCESAFQQFERQHPDLKGISFVEGVLDYFDFGYRVDPRQQERIPTSGRLVIIANHPIGSLDGLALLKMVSDLRGDVKVVANAVLSELAPLEPLLCPVNVFGRTGRKQYQAIQQHLKQEGAVILFPSGEVSRLRPQGVRDTRWHSGFLRLAREAKAPILPIRIAARCSSAFYLTSMVYKPLATLLLVQEMFGQRNKHATMHVGELVPVSSFAETDEPMEKQIQRFKRHLYRLGSKRRPLLTTQSAIAAPQSRKALQQTLAQCEDLGITPDGMRIYLYDYRDDCCVIKEIGRLREVAFRAVGEGTGHRRDLDRFDRHYRHIVLWDPSQLEIVGSYRFGDARQIQAQRGIEGLYSASLFDYGDGMQPYLEQGLELGRSFVQPAYWGKRALDYLWFGIGAVLARNPQYRYLFGPVSLSADFPPQARALIVAFYQAHFGRDPNEALARHRLPYRFDQELEGDNPFAGLDYKTEFTELKATLSGMGISVPTLYKQYSELCEPGGVGFVDFGTDPEFNDCIDGLVLIDVQRLKPHRKARYLQARRPH